MGAVNCRACKGARGRTIGYGNKSRWVDCNACNGSGINRDLWETHCRECYTSIIYPKSGNEPTYCKNCRNKEKTKDCEQWGCTNTIRYKLSWSEVPRYCRNCESKRNKGFTAKSCSGSTFFGSCGKLIWVPPDKNYTMCQECGERDRAEKAAKWKEKRCEGFDGASCSNNIKYNVDWDKVPNLCPSCIAKAKAKREADKAKWKEKACSGTGCRNTIKYNTDWDHPPNLCNDCKEKRTALQRQYPNIKTSFETTDTNYVMPGMGKTIGQMGGVKGKHYPRQGKIHCMVFEGMKGNDLHYSWDMDPNTGEIIGEVYVHHNDPRG